MIKKGQIETEDKFIQSPVNIFYSLAAKLDQKER